MVDSGRSVVNKIPLPSRAATGWPALLAACFRLRVTGTERHMVVAPGRRCVVTLAAVAALSLLSACGSSGEATDPAEDAGAGVSFPLDSMNDSELNGATVLLTPDGSERTRFEIDGIVKSSPFGGGPHEAAVARGDCQQPGEVVKDLGPVRDARAAAGVDLGLAELVKGEFVVAVWFTGDSTRILIACAAIPDSIETG
jgi:hypothetical protein